MTIFRLIAVLLLLALPARALAETLKSTNYSVGESYIGPGGLIDSSSAGYRMSDSIGDTAVGTSSRPKIVLKDDMEVFGGWNALGSGTVAQSSAQAHGGTYSLLKDTNTHPAGGYKMLTSGVGRDWRMEAWLRKDTSNTYNVMRVGLADASTNGYDILLHPGTAGFKIHRYDGSTASTEISTTAGTSISFGVWYRTVFESASGGLLKFSVYDAAGALMGSTQVVDNTHTSGFDRVTVRGGYPYYVDDIEVSNTNAGYRAEAGAPTPHIPSLTFSVDTASVDLGILSSAATGTGTAAFKVKNYVSQGYVVQIVGAAPTNNGRALAALATNAGSSAGTEQFGINLVANTAPAIGSDPVQIPDNSFSFGAAAANYNTANSFRYVSGENIAKSDKSSGQTDFTISYIANIATKTPAGLYTARQELICVPTY